MATVSKKKKLTKDGTAWSVDNPLGSAESVCDARCTLDNHFSPNVEASRISVAMLGTTARNGVARRLTICNHLCLVGCLQTGINNALSPILSLLLLCLSPSALLAGSLQH